ncbi:MAG: NAD(+)/NADH kinase [Sedimentisphaerales bacterium]|nr:NAD(+)/NADH kinase [Sedimentisphaerales bacterium]
MSRPERKKVIMLGNRARSETLQTGEDLKGWLQQSADVVADNFHDSLNVENFPAADYCVVLGGDGTILATVRAMKDRQIPIIGVNLGKLGFLAEFTVAQLREHWCDIIHRPELISRRLMLDCKVQGSKREARVTRAVNEVAVIAGPPFRMIEVSVSVGGEHLAVCSGDGLIVATPTGSTAYNLSAGGPILSPELQAAVITPLAAHSLSFRPIVVTPDVPIMIRCVEVHPTGQVNDPRVIEDGFHGVAMIDGQENLPVGPDDVVTVTKATPHFLLAHNPERGPWQLLNAKLNWGATPNYEHRT